MDTGDLHLLVPRLTVAAGAIVALLGTAAAGVKLNDTLGLGTVLVAALIVIITGVFTLRNNLKAFWKNLAEERGEQVKVLEEKLADLAQQLVDAKLLHTQEMAAFAEEQREVRHQLRNELTATQGLLVVEQAKTDLSSVHGLLVEIRDQLAAYSLVPRERRRAT